MLERKKWLGFIVLPHVGMLCVLNRYASEHRAHTHRHPVSQPASKISNSWTHELNCDQCGFEMPKYMPQSERIKCAFTHKLITSAIIWAALLSRDGEMDVWNRMEWVSFVSWCVCVFVCEHIVSLIIKANSILPCEENAIPNCTAFQLPQLQQQLRCKQRLNHTLCYIVSIIFTVAQRHCSCRCSCCWWRHNSL